MYISVNPKFEITIYQIRPCLYLNHKCNMNNEQLTTFSRISMYSHIDDVTITKMSVSAKSLSQFTAFSIDIYLMDIFQCIGTFK